MRLTRRTTDQAMEDVATTIFEGMSIKGDITGTHNLFLDGELKGKIDLSALLLVGKTGKFKGEVKAKNIIVEGDVEGKLTASEKVEIRNNGKYSGDIIAPSIMISDKAFFQGNVQMVQKGENGAVRTFTEKRSNVEKEKEMEMDMDMSIVEQ